MTNINYYLHLILTNKYSFIIKISIFLGLYLLFYTNQIIYCMNDNPNIVDVPNVAESKEAARPSHQVLALKNEIINFAGSQIEQLETIEQQKLEILQLKSELKNFIEAMNNLYVEHENLKYENEMLKKHFT